MTSHSFLKALVLSLVVSVAPSVAQAHYLWLEQDKSGGHLYFGEYEELLRERSPGRLDEMPGPEIRVKTTMGEARAVQPRREAGGFALAGLPRGGDVIATETGYEVKDWTKSGLGIVKPMFYARLIGSVPTSAAEAMTLDILPTGKAGEFQVVFRGAPLTGIDVRIIAANAWTREASADKDGKVHFDLPWRGQYILHVVKLEKATGEFKGVAYEAVRHRATATFNVSRGPATRIPAKWNASTPH